MIQYAIAKYGENNHQFLKWDESTETVIKEFETNPSHEMCIEALLNYHGAGNQSFSSREGVIDSHVLTRDWPIPTRDMTIANESLPWNNEE